MGCITLVGGYKLGCKVPSATYSQRLVFVNFDEVDKTGLDISAIEESGKLSDFKLKETKKGILFESPLRGVTVQPTAEISFTEAGVTKFRHVVPTLVTAKQSADIAILNLLSKGQFMVVIEFSDNTYHLAGLENGLFATDTTIDLQGGGGASVMSFASVDGKLENLPMIQLDKVTKADFDDLFLEADEEQS